MITACTYPVVNKLAASARPKPCGAEGHLIMTDVPYDDNRTGTGPERVVYRAQMLCVEHSVEIATWKWAQQLPKTPFTDGEIEFLTKQGFEITDLVDATDERSPYYVAPTAETGDITLPPETEN